MVKHIVMWRVEPTETKTKEEIIKDIQTHLKGLVGVIDGLLSVEVGVNYNPSEMAYDVVLYSELESPQALKDYQKHPKHLEVANTYVRPFTVARAVVDYEI